MRNHSFPASFATGCAVLLIGGAGTAHHGVGSYDMREVRELAGTVVAWDWKSPHTWLTLETDAGGAPQTWQIEGAPPQWMSRQGWTAQSLAAGDRVAIVFHPRKDAPYAGILMEVRRDDGEVLKVNRPARLGGP
jgi:hypothetical protein